MEPSRDPDGDDLRPEYDLSQLRGGVRGKYAGRRHKHRPDDGYEQTAAVPIGESNGRLSPEERQTFLTRVRRELEPTLAGCTVPITAEKDGRVVQCGTGTLFRVADVSFLITASHVEEDATRGGYRLGIADALARPPIVPLYGLARGHRELDVVVWELPPKIVAQLPNRKFLTVHHADRANRRPGKGIYLLCGFPECWSVTDYEYQKLSLTPFTQLTGAYEGDIQNLEGYEPRFHILLATPKDDARYLDGPDTGVPDRVHGMSGCSIWQVYYEGLSSRHWTQDDAVVVGVQTGVYRKGAVTKGTRWWVIDQIIRQGYPQLAGPLSLVTPS